MEIIRPKILENQDDILKLRSELQKPKNRLLCIITNFLSTEQPTRITDLMDVINIYYKASYDKSTIYYAVKRLHHQNIVNFESYMEAIHSNGEIHQKIVAKHRSYLSKRIPKNFWDRYHPTKYYFLTPKGESLIEWSCKILGFQFKG